jgi:hypothetical protein
MHSLVEYLPIKTVLFRQYLSLITSIVNNLLSIQDRIEHHEAEN